jgi:chemotaxis-related protein WspD
MSADCWNDVGVWAANGATCPRLAEVVHCHNCDVFSRAGRGLLDQPAPPGYLESWSEALAEAKEDETAAQFSLFVFRIGEEWLALPATAVSEVAEPLPVRRIPGRAAGLVNVHGELHLCFSIQSLLGIAAEEARQPRSIVIGDSEGRWVFPADEVWGLLSVQPNALGDVPVTIARDTRAHVRYIIDWERGKISCLDDKLLFTTLQSRVRDA